jgi:hypothetical protein
MRARNDDWLSTAQEALMQNLWQGLKRDVVIEDMLEFHVAARNRIPNYYYVRTRLQIVF